MIHHYLINECGYSPQEVAIGLKGWTMLPLIDDNGETAGEAMIKENEIHVALSQTRRKNAFNRRNVREFFRPLLDEKKFLVTRQRVGDTRAERFIQQLGFVKTHQDSTFTYWWLDRLPFSRT